VTWWRYGAVAVVDGGVTVIGDDAAAVERLADALRREPRQLSCQLSRFEPAEPDSVHLAHIRRILGLISEGSLYQVNLARCFVGRASGSALSLYARLFANARVPFGFALELDGKARICGASPELCLEHRANGTLVTRPIKGTRPRGRDDASDLAQIRELESDPKEQAELVMVVDLERNDLGMVSERGSVEVLSAGETETYEALHHRVATVRSRLRAGVSREELLRAFLPSGSVTGTPKLSAMQQIAQLERERRGLYTGAIGYIGQDGGLRLAMAIRTLVVEAEGTSRYFAGGGIVADSCPEREVDETRWKSSQLLGAHPVSEGRSGDTPANRQSSERTFAENWADWLGSCTEEGESICCTETPASLVAGP
jgi:anthranilate/para-aminobenzoate synthase component I